MSLPPSITDFSARSTDSKIIAGVLPVESLSIGVCKELNNGLSVTFFDCGVVGVIFEGSTGVAGLLPNSELNIFLTVFDKPPSSVAPALAAL